MLCWKSCTCVLVSLLVLLPDVVLGGYEKTCSPERMREGPAAQTLCGHRLSDAIAMICSMQGFNVTPNRRKRNELAAPQDLKDIIASKSDSLAFLGKRSWGLERTGVVCECCYHQCSFGELSEYCADTSKRSPIPSRHRDLPVNNPSLDLLDRW